MAPLPHRRASAQLILLDVSAHPRYEWISQRICGVARRVLGRGRDAARDSRRTEHRSTRSTRSESRPERGQADGIVQFGGPPVRPAHRQDTSDSYRADGPPAGTARGDDLSFGSVTGRSGMLRSLCAELEGADASLAGPVPSQIALPSPEPAGSVP